MLDRSNREKEDAKKELMEAQTQLTVLKTKGEADENEISSLKSQLEQANRRLAENHEKLLVIDEEHVHLRLLVDGHNKDKDDLKTAYDRLQTKKEAIILSVN